MWEEFELWAETYRKPFIQRSTYIKYERTTEMLKDHFDNEGSDLVKRIDLQRFFNELSAKYGHRTIKTIYHNVAAFYQSLVDDGAIDRNPMNNIRFTGVEKEKKRKYLEVEDVKKLVASLDLDDQRDLMIYVALKTGMRFAEVLGVTPDDLIDHDGSYLLSINKTLDYKYTKQFKSTKTKTSVRDISIDKEVFDCLVSLAHKKGIGPDESIFGVEYPAELNRLLLLKCKSISSDPISFHGLRHTHCSLLLRDGIPIISVSKRLGHSDTTVTQKVYTHLMSEQEHEDNASIVKLLEAI